MLADTLKSWKRLPVPKILRANIKITQKFVFKTSAHRHKPTSNFSLYENKANKSRSGNLMKIQRSEHLSVERVWLQNRDGDETKRRSRGSLRYSEGKEMDWIRPDRARSPPNRNSFCSFKLIPQMFSSLQLLHRCFTLNSMFSRISRQDNGKTCWYGSREAYKAPFRHALLSIIFTIS